MSLGDAGGKRSWVSRVVGFDGVKYQSDGAGCLDTRRERTWHSAPVHGHKLSPAVGPRNITFAQSSSAA